MELKGDIHVMPVDDLWEHVDSDDCWCEPRLEGESRPFVVVHHSADRREFFEGRIMPLDGVST